MIEKLRKFAAVAEKHDVILLHENEKTFTATPARRCRVIFEALAKPAFPRGIRLCEFCAVRRGYGKVLGAAAPLY